MKEIALTKGFKTLVDDDIYDRLIKRRWHYSHGYAVRSMSADEVEPGGTKKKVFMHLEIFSPGDGCITGHIDGNKLNNQKHNLRSANKQLNQANAGFQVGRSSRFKGVTWHKRYEKWQSGITIGGKYKFLGYFHCECQAAMAYDSAAKLQFGVYSRTNF